MCNKDSHRYLGKQDDDNMKKVHQENLVIVSIFATICYNYNRPMDI